MARKRKKNAVQNVTENNGTKPRKWRRPKYSSWRKVQGTTSRTVRVERRKEIEDWQAFFALSIIIFLTFFIGSNVEDGIHENARILC